MTGVSEIQLDYIYFFYGLGLITLAGVCFQLRKSDQSKLPWAWFALYGLLQGLNQWVGMFSPALGNYPAASYPRIVLGCLGFICLLEFARLGQAQSKKRGYGRWVIAVLVGTASLGLIHGWPGLNAASRYVLCLTGGLWSAAVLLSASKDFTGIARRSLAVAGVACGVYSLLGAIVVPRAEFFPANVVNYESFFSLFGFPYILIKGIAALVLGLSVWVYWRSVCAVESEPNAELHTGTHAMLILMLVLVTGWAVTTRIGKRINDEFGSSLSCRALALAVGIDSRDVETLRGAPSDMTSPTYGRLRGRLGRLIQDECDDHQPVSSADLMGIRRGKMVFLVDVDADDPDGRWSPGDVYEPAREVFATVARTGGEVVRGPVTNASGTWLNASAPVLDGDTGRVAAILTLGVEASDYLRALALHRLSSILVTLLLCVLILTYSFTLQTARDAAANVTASENRYRSFIDGCPSVVVFVDREGRLASINQAGLGGLGLPEANVTGKQFVDLWTKPVRAIAGNAVALVMEGKRCSFEADYIRPDGRSITYYVVLNPITDRKGGIAGFAGILTDVTDSRHAEQALAIEKERLAITLRSIGDGVIATDTNGNITLVNGVAERLTGWSEADSIGRPLDEVFNIVHEITGKKAPNPVEQVLETGSPVELANHTALISADGSHRSIADSCSPIRDLEGNLTGVVLVFRDITERKRAEDAIKIQTSAMNAASDQIVITNVQGIIEFVNPAFEKETGFSISEVIGKTPRIMKSGKHDAEYYNNMWLTILNGKPWSGEITNRRKDGSVYVEDMTITPIKNDNGAIERFVAVKRNITLKKAYEEQLDYLAYHDPLTGLPNRLLFSDRLTQRLAQAQRRQSMIAVMFLDVDRFKLINDTLGHNIGDLLLRSMAERLQTCVREADTIARMGGDEFTIILADVVDPEAAGEVARRVLRAVASPFVFDEHELYVTTSIGISIYPTDGMDVETLVKNADTAMYRAKEKGRNMWQLYTEAFNAADVERMTLENNLRRAAEREEFLLHFQPQVDIRTGETRGSEALARWRHPDYGLVPPGKFIPLAEETGLIVPISKWIIKAACKQNKTWQDAGYPPISIAVNISAKHFQQEDLAATVGAALSETGLDSRYLELELTESALMQNPELAVEMLRKLKEMGVRISVDDFGTGYSSLSYLKRFPIDAVKIDQSFVRNITTNPDDAAIAGAVVAMAHSLKLKVIAEGVETLEQLEFLRSLKCDEVQGYFISRPLPGEDFEQILGQIDDPSTRAFRPAA